MLVGPWGGPGREAGKKEVRYPIIGIFRAHEWRTRPPARLTLLHRRHREEGKGILHYYCWKKMQKEGKIALIYQIHKCRGFLTGRIV